MIIIIKLIEVKESEYCCYSLNPTPRIIYINFKYRITKRNSSVGLKHLYSKKLKNCL